MSFLSFIGGYLGAWTTGTNSSTEVPSLYPVAIDGHPFNIDWESKQFSHDSIPLLKPYYATESDKNELTLNPEAGWRRSVVTWNHGAGQLHLDDDDSDRAQFFSSKGIDPWTQWQLTLQPDTEPIRTTTENNLQLVTAGPFIYVSDGDVVQWKNVGDVSWSNSGVSATVKSLTTDGHTVYVALGTGVATTVRGSSSTTTGWNALVADVLGYVNGRLMASAGPNLYNITGAGAAPAALWTHPNSDFQWVGFAEGASCFYAAGFSGDKSEVWRIGISSDGTTLVVPIAALPGIPSGEIVATIGAYLGFVAIGDSKGVRLAEPDSNGNLTLGARINTTSPVRCTVGADKFFWFGMENYDATSTGLGRMDLQTETADGVPAYASDLMASAQGSVTSAVSWDGGIVFAVAGVGVYAQQRDDTGANILVGTGELLTGVISFNIPDPKVIMYADIRRSQPQIGAFSVSLSADDGEFALLGTQTDSGHNTILSGQQSTGEQFRCRIVLTPSATDPPAGPVISRFTLTALPAAQSGQTFTVPLLIARREAPAHDTSQTRNRNIDTEITFVEQLRSQKRVVVYQEYGRVYTVTMDDFKVVPVAPDEDARELGNVTIVVQLKTVDPPIA